jgi:phosphoribosylformylglycinamidine synthase II
MRRVIMVSALSDEELEREIRKAGANLSVYEVRRIREILGRDPTPTELHLFNAEWSEHCSYKSSKKILKKYLPTDAPNVVLGVGEDAGIVFLTEFEGKRWCAVIAHESHNHPSQILPVEGAATGIGGIVRDVDCMGARVIGVADGLRFGDPYGPNKERVRWIANGVVDGIWQYGNALGVPNLAGDVVFSDCFDDNCLVNVIAVGIVAEDEIIRSRVPERAWEEEYDIILVGKPTDDSGFGGAAFASEILDESRREESRGAVQVPDPFLKNVLLLRKANEEVLARSRELGMEIGFKDLGAGGIGVATAEICSAGGFGADIDLDKVHVAMEGLLPEVITCSETQERYTLVVPSSFSEEVLRIYNEVWELPSIYEGARASVIGKVRRDGRYVVRYKGEVVCDVPIKAVTEGISYDREARPPKRELSEPDLQEPEDLNQVIIKLLRTPNCSSRENIYRIYDTEVQGNAVLRPGEADAGLIAPIPGSSVGLALSIDGNPFYGRISPYWAGATAVAEGMRNVAAIGAIPWAITDCLNFGNPEKPEAFWDFVESVRGIADAAAKIWLKGMEGVPVPIVSGNVSFYNESSSGKAVDPSPIIACLGIMKDYSKAVTMRLKRPGDPIYLIGERRDELGGSAYYLDYHGVLGRNVPTVDFEEERGAIYAVTDAIDLGIIKASHDISNGGLAITLAEMMMGGYMTGKFGVDIDLDQLDSPLRTDKVLFSESGGFVLEVEEGQEDKFLEIVSRYGVKAYRIGEVKDEGRLIIRRYGRKLVDLPIRDCIEAWRSGLVDAMS